MPPERGTVRVFEARSVDPASCELICEIARGQVDAGMTMVVRLNSAMSITARITSVASGPGEHQTTISLECDSELFLGMNLIGDELECEA